MRKNFSVFFIVSFADRVIKATPGVAQGQSGTLFPRFFGVFSPFSPAAPTPAVQLSGSVPGSLQSAVCLIGSLSLLSHTETEQVNQQSSWILSS